ncbi:MAG: phosphoenolpyruvate--protein phosphotransferase, partial [Schwartzia sp.]|nr:phosphoenolpyruvate--protein phosphotransferase [Schwartzia sp. (in: firmicutes)]
AVSEEALHGPAVMRDGAEVTLRANVGNAEEAVESQKKGASGIGLFRSEFLFIGRDSLPDEEEQYEAYKKAVEACGKAPCIIRTLDVGGDKKLPAFPIPKEDNPFLGVRGIRAELRNETVLRTQLRALLRAAACGHCAVMLPMVTNPSEIDRVKVIAGEELMALKEEGKEAVLPNFGAMIETPAAAVCAENIAKHAGFFSIGTNDLAQYTLAADRTNEAVADIGDALHPAVLRLIKHTIEAANAAGIPVTICGEIASDTLAAPILAAMGRVALSMGAGSLSRVRSALKEASMEEAKEKLEKALSLEDAKAVREFLK